MMLLTPSVQYFNISVFLFVLLSHRFQSVPSEVASRTASRRNLLIPASVSIFRGVHPRLTFTVEQPFSVQHLFCNFVGIGLTRAFDKAHEPALSYRRDAKAPQSLGS